MIEDIKREISLINFEDGEKDIYTFIEKTHKILDKYKDQEENKTTIFIDT